MRAVIGGLPVAPVGLRAEPNCGVPPAVGTVHSLQMFVSVVQSVVKAIRLPSLDGLIDLAPAASLIAALLPSRGADHTVPKSVSPYVMNTARVPAICSSENGSDVASVCKV